MLDAAIDLTAGGASAEFRRIAAVFISFELADWSAFVTTVLDLTADYGGYFNKLDFGDKGPVILVLFGAPVAHENDPERAADFLLALKDATRSQFWRAGLTCGTAYAGIVGGDARCEYTAIGDVVNFASRLMTRAEWGQILVPDSVAEIPALELEHAGDLEYTGLTGPRPTYRLLGRISGAESFFEHPLVGRQTELQQLSAAAQIIFEGKFAGVAYIYGEAGIGKSHLVYELRRRLQRQGVTTHFAGQTDQILRQAFNPFAYFLKRYFDQSPEASPDENKANFAKRFDRLLCTLKEHPSQSLISELVRTRSILGALLGLHWPGSLYESLDAKLRYQNTLIAIKTLLLAESCLHPVVLEVEDLHWLDESSRKALTILSRDVAGYPLFIVVTSRYLDDGSKPTLALAGDAPVTTIDLDVLAPAGLRRLAQVILGGLVSDDLLALLQERTQANPFFAQQFLYYFRENDLLDQVADTGEWTVKATIPADVPTTINAILIARLDRLAQNVKEVVKGASVLGREFDDRVLARMLQADVSPEVRAAEREQIWSEVR